MANGWIADPGLEATPEPATARRALITFAILLAILALLLAGGVAGSARLRPPAERVPAATFAARQGIALPAALAVPSPTSTPAAGAAGAYPCASPDCWASAARSGTPPMLPGVPAGSALRPADSPSAREAVTAYLRAWDVWAEACLTLDPVPLEGVFAPPELDRARAYVRQLGASGRLMRLEAAHRVTVLELDGDTALLLDELTDRSLYLDPTTRRPLSPGAQPTPVGTERLRCRLQRMESGWRVIELIWGQ